MQNLYDIKYPTIKKIKKKRSKWKKAEQYYSWSKEEDDLLSLLVHHFGEDFDLIAEQINYTFQYENMTGSSCRKKWKNYENPLINREPISQEEMDILYPKFFHFVVLDGYNLWECMRQCLTTSRTCQKISTSFLYYLQSVYRRLIFMYADESQTVKYISRFNLMRPVTIYIMAYITVCEPIEIEIYDPTFQKIVKAIKTLHAFTNYFYKENLVFNFHIASLFEKEIMISIPQCSEDNFKDMIEPILVLDTINKICLNTIPYTNLPQKPFNKMSNRTKNNLFEPDISKLFEPLNSEELQMIQNSQLVQQILPYYQNFQLTKL